MHPSTRRPATLSSLAGLAAISTAAFAQPKPEAQPKPDVTPGTSITIYSSMEPGGIQPQMYRPVAGQGVPQFQIPGYAVVRDVRVLNLPKGRGEVKFTDVAALIDPTTVSFTSIADPNGTSVLEQNYQFDLVSNERLLEKFIDKPITVTVVRGDKAETITGTLLSTQGGILLKHDDGDIEVLNGYSGLSLPKLPEGLITRPTLVWDVNSKAGGPQQVRVGYQTEGITWWTDYNIVYDEKNNSGGTMDLSAWVSILNHSGATYADAKLKLIAGDVHRAPVARNMSRLSPAAASQNSLGMDGGFEEKTFFEYHLYTLGRPTTIPDRSTKQVELFPAAHKVPVEKVLVYNGLGQNFWFDPYNPIQDQNFGVQSNKDVDVYLRFKNSKEQGLGMPLPAGKIRVSKLDTADGSLEFIGEDLIKHTPRDEQVLVKMGHAFDVVGERKQTEFKSEGRGRVITESYEIKVRNHKDTPVDVIVTEPLFRWSTWEITKSSPDFKKVDSRTIQFPLTIPKDGEGAVTYTVRYTW
jgi:hypothetical protein